MSNLDQFKKNGKFLMLAFDHRGSLKKLINPENPDSVTDEELIALKKEVIEAVYDQMGSVLIDEQLGLPALKQIFESGKEPKPYLMPLEKSGYEQQGKERLTTLEKTASELKQLGATAAKLLLFFNPYAASAQKQIEIAKKAIEDCKANDLPFFLEPRTYNDQGLEADKMEEGEREQFAIESLKKLVNAGVIPDVYKLEYPGTALACQTYSAVFEGKNIPWIMLTMGASFEEFTKQLEEASIRGCQGFLAGRALWQEACTLKGEEKAKFLKETLPERFKIISEIICKQ
jgi:tagatose 1,6-diphosphate aldolase